MNLKTFVDGYKKYLAEMPTLSKGELFCFKMLGQGYSTKEIANIKGNFRSIKTIESYFEHTKYKLGIKDRAFLNKFAIQFYIFTQLTNKQPQITITKVLEFVEVEKLVINVNGLTPELVDS